VGRLTKRAAFLDRDGTINVRPPAHHYLSAPDEVVLLPGAAEGASRLARAGYVLAVVSNQRGVARGLLDLAALRAVEERIRQLLADDGCEIELFRYCTHDDAAGCACRKPRPGLILEAAEELEIDLRSSWMIGDSESDVLAGQAAGCRTVLIGAVPEHAQPDLVAPSLEAASRLIVDSATAYHDPPRTRQRARRR
jgi:D-glycero-D-manno-heptose 1,7-bisphosphate phosphatase